MTSEITFKNSSSRVTQITDAQSNLFAQFTSLLWCRILMLIFFFFNRSVRNQLAGKTFTLMGCIKDALSKVDLVGHQWSAFMKSYSYTIHFLWGIVVEIH